MERKERLDLLRKVLAGDDISAMIIPSTDPHFGEYIPDHYKVLEWLSGFTGEAATLVVTQEEAALWCLHRKEPISTPVNVQCLFFMPTARRVDLVNLLEAACDVLVAAGVLADDNSDIVRGHDGSEVFVDRENPRTEIHITEYERKE